MAETARGKAHPSNYNGKAPPCLDGQGPDQEEKRGRRREGQCHPRCQDKEGIGLGGRRLQST